MVWARVIAVAALIALHGPPVAARAVCGPHAAMAERLASQFGEARRGTGLAGMFAIYELWTDAADGSWSILRVGPSGLTCLVAAGGLWHDYEPPPKGEPT